MFFKNMPTDIGPARDRSKSRLAPSQHIVPDTPLPPTAPQSDIPPDDWQDTGDSNNLYYEGKLRFSNLGKSLKPFRSHSAKSPFNATVFAAGSLGSVSDLLPLACRMANEKLNTIHFVLMGRDDISIEGIQQVNGLDDVNCPINWHDARPEYAQYSTDGRMEQAVATTLPYIKAYLRPQVLITQGELLEDLFFTRGIRESQNLGISHIALPRAARELMWMATLDGHALRNWNDIHVEFLIYAAPDSAGSIIRLIKSLEHADFLGFSPSLTIDLPSHVDPELLRFLKGMQWPPNTSSKITVRRRIRSHRISPGEASVRAVEAFYPKDLTLSHVLVLSPDMELAPSFYHYLMFTMLRYRYSTRSSMLPSRLMGISLELPSSPLTNIEHFKQPKIGNTRFLDHNAPDALPLFLWQVPNSNAALYFGDKWAELHSFLSQRLVDREADSGGPLEEKLISKRYPAFLEPLLELLRAKGYHLLYPAFSDKGRFSLATFHNELSQPPEESFPDGLDVSFSEALGESSAPERPLSKASTLMALLDTFSLELPDITHLPLLSYRGEEMSESLFNQETEEYRGKFKVRYGGCPDDSRNGGSPEDLFCED